MQDILLKGERFLYSVHFFSHKSFLQELLLSFALIQHILLLGSPAEYLFSESPTPHKMVPLSHFEILFHIRNRAFI